MINFILNLKIIEIFKKIMQIHLKCYKKSEILLSYILLFLLSFSLLSSVTKPTLVYVYGQWNSLGFVKLLRETVEPEAGNTTKATG